MKSLISIFFLLFLFSCGTKVPFTNEIATEYSLDGDKELKKVQFFTSQTLILEKSSSSGNNSTDDSGVLVSSSNKNENRIIIPMYTKCVYEGMDKDSSFLIRFETGVGKTLSFAARKGQQSGKYYLVATWVQSKGGSLKYGNDTYNVTSTGGNTHLLVALKKLQQTNRKDRVVKGMKI